MKAINFSSPPCLSFLSLRGALRDVAIYSLCFFLTMLITTRSFGQTQKQLKVGDTIPDLYIGGFVNHASTSLSHLHKDGLLIINFWATWCGPCLKELPVLDSAVTESKGRLHVISTSYEPVQTVTSFLQNRKDIPTSHLRLLPADTSLHQLFPHRLIPHNIWVDSKGIIRHISGSESINRKNIDQFLKGNPTSVQEKKDVLDFDYRKPFHLRDSSFAYRSIFSDYNPGIGSGILFFTILKKEGTYINRIFMWNQTINKLYLAAHSNMSGSFKDTSLIEIKTKDSLKFFWPKLAPKSMVTSKYKTEQDWQRGNLFTYELMLQKPVIDSLAFKYVMDDLKRNFDLRTEIQLRKRWCLVITTKNRKPKIKESTADSTFITLQPNSLHVQKATIKEIIVFLNRRFRVLDKLPRDSYVINDSKITYPIDLRITTTEELTLERIYDLLQTNYGFVFKKQIRSYPILVIEDVPK